MIPVLYSRIINIVLLIISGLIIVSWSVKYFVKTFSPSQNIDSLLCSFMIFLSILISFFYVFAIIHAEKQVTHKENIRIDKNFNFIDPFFYFFMFFFNIIQLFFTISAPFIMFLNVSGTLINLFTTAIALLAFIIFLNQIILTFHLYKINKFIKQHEMSEKTHNDSSIFCKYEKDKNGNLSTIMFYNAKKMLFIGANLELIGPDLAVKICEELTEEGAEAECICNNYKNISDKYIEQKEYKKALACINKAIMLSRKNAACFEQKGTILFYLQKYNESLKIFLIAENENGLQIESYIKMSLAYSILKDFNNANCYAEKALKKNGNNGDAMYAKGFAYFMIKNYKEAYSLFKKAKKNRCRYVAVNDYIHLLCTTENIDPTISQHFLD